MQLLLELSTELDSEVKSGKTFQAGHLFGSEKVQLVGVTIHCLPAGGSALPDCYTASLMGLWEAAT